MFPQNQFGKQQKPVINKYPIVPKQMVVRLKRSRLKLPS